MRIPGDWRDDDGHGDAEGRPSEPEHAAIVYMALFGLGS